MMISMMITQTEFVLRALETTKQTLKISSFDTKQ